MFRLQTVAKKESLLFKQTPLYSSLSHFRENISSHQYFTVKVIVLFCRKKVCTLKKFSPVYELFPNQRFSYTPHRLQTLIFKNIETNTRDATIFSCLLDIYVDIYMFTFRSLKFY